MRKLAEKKERKGTKSIALCVLLICILTVLFSKEYHAEGVTENAEKSGRVLFISSYSYGWNTVQLQIEGIKKGLGENIVID